MKQVLIVKPKTSIASHEMGSCSFCNNVVYVSDFKDRIGFREFIQSGMCQDCQDECCETKNVDREEPYMEID